MPPLSEPSRSLRYPFEDPSDFHTGSRCCRILLSIEFTFIGGGSRQRCFARRNSERDTAADSVPVAPVVSASAGPGLVPDCPRDLYAELDGALTAWGRRGRPGGVVHCTPRGCGPSALLAEGVSECFVE